MRQTFVIMTLNGSEGNGKRKDEIVIQRFTWAGGGGE